MFSKKKPGAADDEPPGDGGGAKPSRLRSLSLRSRKKDGAAKPKDDGEAPLLKSSRLNFYSEYKERRQREHLEQIKQDSQLQERLAQEVERDKMEAEEKHSWEAYELPGRNRLRLIRVHTEAQAKLSAKRVAVAKKEVKDQEEGFTYHNSVLKQFLRWRDSPALQRYYTGHKGQVYAFKMADSLDCVLSASEDTTLKLWDFHTGKCVRTFEGHGKAVRDCDLSPQFSLSNRAGLGLAVSCSTDKTLRIWDARTGATRREMRGHTDVIYAARFRPDGKHVCSASADRTVRLWDAVEGHLVYVFRGHKSAVVSAAYSSSGRFIASASDYGERAIKVWDADMPGVKSATNVLQRVQWTKEGLISRFLLFVDPPKALLEDPSKRRDRAAIAKRGAANGDAWDALSDGEGEEDESERVERERDEKQSDAAASDDGGLMAGDVREACGFSLSVASVDRFQRRTQVESYFGNVQLQLVLRGVGDISEFFVGGYGRAQVHDAFVSESGERRGEFARELPLGMRHACGKAAVNSRRFAPRPEVVLDWRAPEAGGGAVVLRCTVAGEDGVRRALSYTLAEVEAPKKGSLLSDAAAAGKATAQKFDFTASVLHQLFIELVRNGDFSEAASMVGPNARLKVRAAKRLEDFVKGKEAVLARVLEYMANGVSFVKEANDVDPGKSAAVVVHGEPLEYPESDAEPEARDLDAGLDEAKLKRGDDEMRHVRKLRGRRLACAEEVRLLYAPASVPGKEAKRKEAAADFFIAEGKYGGAIPHMQMPLPETYPLNARTDAGAERARKGREAMNTGPPGAQKGRKAKGPDALWPSSRAERKAVARGLARVAEQRTIAARNESSSRRNAHVLLPGFEGLSTDLGTAPHVRAAAATAAGQPFYPFPDRGGARQLLRIKADVEAKAGALKSSRFSAFSLGASIRSRTSALGSPLSPISSRRGTPLGSTQDLLLSPLGSRRGSPLGSRRGSPVGSTQDLLLSSLGSPLGSPLGSQQTLSLEDGSPAGTPVAPHSSRLSSSAAISLTRPETPQSRPSSRGAAGASPQLSRPSSSRSAILSRPSTRGASPLRPSSRGASGASPQSSRPSSRGASPPPSRPSSRGATGASPTRPSSRDSRPSSRGASPLPSRPSSRGASGAPPHSSRRSSHGALERRPSISAGGLRPLTPSTGLLLETSESLSASPLSSKGTAGGRTFLLDDDGEDEDEDSPAFEGDTGGADGKIATAPRLRRRNSFATLPGLAPKPASAIAEAQKSGRETIRAKLRGGCRLTFRVTENDFHAHHHTVNEVTWSVDERRVASCSNDRTVRLWEPESGRCVRTLVGHDDAVMGAGFSEDGLRLVSRRSASPPGKQY